MRYRLIHLRPPARRLTLSALTAYLLLLTLPACGQSKSRPPAATQPVAPPKVAVPARLPAVCTPTVATLALQLADGSCILSAYVRAENFPVNGWARYRPDGQLDTVFCRNVARLPFGAQEVVEAPGGKLWVQFLANRFDPKSLALLLRLHADGTVDSTFKANIIGQVSTFLALPDGRLLLGGQWLQINGQPLGSLACLRPDGTVDAAFAAAVGSTEGVVTHLARQRDGRLLVGSPGLKLNGQAAPLWLFRLSGAGQIDASFQPPSASPLMALTVQPDDKILLLRGRGAGTLTRLLPTGADDPSFRLRLRQPLYISHNRPPLLVLADGRILLPGHTQSGQPPANNPRWRSLLCVAPNGEQDTTFRYRAQPAQIFALRQLPGGRLLVASSLLRYPEVPATRFTPTSIVTLTADGAPEPAQVPPLLQSQGTVRALVLQPDGRLVLGGGFSAVGPVPVQNLARLQPDGRPDTAFSRRCATDGPIDRLLALPDGRLLASGYFRQVGGLPRAGLVRLLPDGQPDPDFVPPLLPVQTLGESIRGVAVQADGKVLLAGNFKLADGRQQKLLRLTSTGQVDASFQPPASTEDAQGLLLQPDGRILVASYPSLVRRLLPDGALDPSFTTPRYSGLVVSMAQYPDGRILVGGSFGAGGFNGIPQLKDLARLRPDGSADPDFHPPAFRVNFLTTLAVLPDGRLLVGGTGRRDSEGNYAAPFSRLTRLLPNGQPDPAAISAAEGPDGDVHCLLPLPDGSTLVGGWFTHLGPLPSSGLGQLAPPVQPPAPPLMPPWRGRIDDGRCGAWLLVPLLRSRQPPPPRQLLKRQPFL